jgi:hypothetical protein
MYRMDMIFNLRTFNYPDYPVDLDTSLTVESQRPVGLLF